MTRASLPYSDASSCQKAYAEIEKILRTFGCTQFGIMNDWQAGADFLSHMNFPDGSRVMERAAKLLKAPEKPVTGNG